MKKFDTLSELDVLHLAYTTLLRNWDKEKHDNEKTISLIGRENIISKSRIEKYESQLEELHSEILRLEKLED